MKENVIKKLRRERSLTQTELAKKSNISLAQIQRMEYNDKYLMSLSFERTIRLAIALDVPLSSLVIPEYAYEGITSDSNSLLSDIGIKFDNVIKLLDEHHLIAL